MANTMSLQIASMDGIIFEGPAQSILCRTINGDIQLLANHCNYCSAIGMGTAKVTFVDGSSRYASCIGGMLTMMDNKCRIIATTWEWSDEIDLNRAKAAKEKAEKKLQNISENDKEYVAAMAKLKRSLVRINSASIKD